MTLMTRRDQFGSKRSFYVPSTTMMERLKPPGSVLYGKRDSAQNMQRNLDARLKVDLPASTVAGRTKSIPKSRLISEPLAPIAMTL